MFCLEITQIKSSNAIHLLISQKDRQGNTDMAVSAPAGSLGFSPQEHPGPQKSPPELQSFSQENHFCRLIDIVVRKTHLQ